MLLTLVVILVLIGAAVVGSLYSNFLVFYQNFTETENYHKARYASIAAIERAELVIKQRAPGYVGNGGWKSGEIGSTGYSDQIISDFSYLSNEDDEENDSTLFRKINSRTDRIPSLGSGNVEKLLSADDSPDYNMMDYENAEVFLLYYDDSEGRPYDKAGISNITPSKLDGIKVGIRLPLYVRYTGGNFGDLDASSSLIQGGYRDDALVDWQLRGNYDGKQFAIFSTQDAAGFNASDRDSAIRESDLNQLSGVELDFEKYRNPKTNKSPRNNTPPTIISSEDSPIRSFVDGGGLNGFKTIFNNNQGSFPLISNLQLRFSLLNLVLGDGSFAKRYPFLEYYVEFIPHGGDTVIVSDKYFNIQTEGNYGDYRIDTVIFKPTIVESILKSFTTIL